jgi:hypothetical protein
LPVPRGLEEPVVPCALCPLYACGNESAETANAENKTNQFSFHVSCLLSFVRLSIAFAMCGVFIAENFFINRHPPLVENFYGGMLLCIFVVILPSLSWDSPICWQRTLMS